MNDTDRDLLPEGLGDRLPANAAAAQALRRALLDVLGAHGYDRIETPSIEFEKSMASRMAGFEVRRMFRFVDPASLRTLALRSDITVQVGRIAATSLAAAPRPLRLCYAGQVVTIQGDGLDPARERLQVGAELIGNDSVSAAAEIVALAIEALQAAGATGVGASHRSRSDFQFASIVGTPRSRLPMNHAMRMEGIPKILDPSKICQSSASVSTQVILYSAPSKLVGKCIPGRRAGRSLNRGSAFFRFFRRARGNGHARVADNPNGCLNTKWGKICSERKPSRPITRSSTTSVAPKQLETVASSNT